VPRRVPPLYVKQYQVNFLKFLIAEAIAQETVAVQGRVNPHGLGSGE
jgi:hypothetical protein